MIDLMGPHIWLMMSTNKNTEPTLSSAHYYQDDHLEQEVKQHIYLSFDNYELKKFEMPWDLHNIYSSKPSKNCSFIAKVCV